MVRLGEPSLGNLTVRVVEAVYDAEFVSGQLDTYCALWLLESVKWRRRKSAKWGSKRGDDPMRPQWDQEFEFDEVRDDAKIVVDVWNADDSGKEDFLGKVTLRLADLLLKPAPAWFELVPGRICLQLGWTALTATGDPAADPVPLSLPASAAVQQQQRPPPPPDEVKVAAPAPVPAPAPAPAASKPPAYKAPGPVVDEVEEVEEIEEIEAYDDEFESESPVAARAPAPAAAKAAAASSFKLEFFEYTHKGGDGTGPKENQDAKFTIKFDDRNYILAVLDGHGGENGAIASQAAAEAMEHYFRANFDKVKSEPEAAMTRAFELAHDAIYKAIKRTEGTFEKDGMLVMEVDEEDWPLGYDAVDGGSTASVAAIIDGERLVYAAVGDSCSLYGVPGVGGQPNTTIELIPEHSPTNLNEWAERLHSSGIHVLYDSEMMFEGPEHMLHVFCRDPSAPSGWKMDQESIRRADAGGCGFKTERGDRAAMLVTPEEGKFSQMMLGVTRSLGDFYHQQYGVTWRPEVMVKPLSELAGGKPESMIVLASDGFWDHWTFEDAVDDLTKPNYRGGPATDKHVCHDWFENTRERGAEAFGNHADNLTAIVANISLGGGDDDSDLGT